jgi:hypothetical protein
MDNAQNCDSYINIPSSQTYIDMCRDISWEAEAFGPGPTPNKSSNIFLYNLKNGNSANYFYYIN